MLTSIFPSLWSLLLTLGFFSFAEKAQCPALWEHFMQSSSTVWNCSVSVTVPQANTPYGGDFDPSVMSPHMALGDIKGSTRWSPLPGERIRLWADGALSGGPGKGRLHPTAREGIFPGSIPEAEKRVRSWVSLTRGIVGFFSWKQSHFISSYL